MKFKRFFIAFLMILFLLHNCLAAGAWTPDYKFDCTISPENIPSGTVYIDLLLPISENDDGYTEFNKENGKKYNILSDSEIVKYNHDDYRSYTFHISDAYSEMEPYYEYYFTLENDIYNEHYEKLKVLEDYKSSEFEGSKSYYIRVIDGSSLQQELDRIAEIDDFKYWNTYYKEEKYTEYNPDIINRQIEKTKYDKIRESEYDFDYCCKKYKWAKMAYLDADGNILGVSSKARIKPYKQLNLKLSGENFTSNIQSGPPIYILAIFIISIPIIVVIALIIFIIHKYIKRRQKMKEMKDFYDFIERHLEKYK